MRTRRRAIAASIAVLALSYGTLGCGDDDTTASDDTEITADDADLVPTTERDRDRDRDRIHDAIAEIASACQNEPDRLRDMVGEQLQDQVRERLQDQSCMLDGSEDVEIVDEDIEIDGDTATARFTFRHRHRGEQQEEPMTWRFRWTEENGWVLDDLDALFPEE